MRGGGQFLSECAEIQIFVKPCADQGKEICGLSATKQPPTVTLSIEKWLDCFSFLHAFSYNSVIP